MVQSSNNRLKAARMAAGYAKAVHAAQNFGWNISTFRAHENGQNAFDFTTAQVYARAFNVSPAWLLTGEGEISRKNRDKRQVNNSTNVATSEFAELQSNDTVFISGLVGEGYWISNRINDTREETVTSQFPADPRFSASLQFDLRLLGNRALPYARDGEIVRCVSILKPEIELKPNDILVIETTRNDLKERKLRILSSASGGQILINFEGLSQVDPFFLGQTIMGETVSVIGKVLFKYEFVESFVSKRPVVDFIG